MDSQCDQMVFNRALGIVLRQIDKEVKGLARLPSINLDDYPLILDHSILRSDVHAPYLKRIIGQIKSSENTARRVNGERGKELISSSVSDEHENNLRMLAEEDACDIPIKREDGLDSTFVHSQPSRASIMKCCFCDKELSSRQRLADHLNIHTGNKRE